MNDEGSETPDAEDARKERAFGNGAVDLLCVGFEETQSLALLVEIVGVDGGDRAAFLGQQFDAGSFELKTAAADNPGNHPTCIEAKNFQLNGVARLASF